MSTRSSPASCTEGEAKFFLVGEFEPVGAKFCDATPEQEEALQAVRDQIAAGEFDELFGEIKGEAYGGGEHPSPRDEPMTDRSIAAGRRR